MSLSWPIHSQFCVSNGLWRVPQTNLQCVAIISVSASNHEEVDSAFSTAVMTYADGFRSATALQHTRVQGHGGRDFAWGRDGLAPHTRKARRGKGLGARPGNAGLEVQPAVQPREAGAQPTFHPFGPCFPANKGRAVSDRRKSTG